MPVTLSGIVILAKEEQSLNAEYPMLASLPPDAKVTVFNLEQL